MYDVVTVGEGMLRLSPPRYERIRRMHTLDVHICGSQGNVACNIARLGLKTAFVTKLPENALGLLAKDHYMSCGVDASHIKLVPGGTAGGQLPRIRRHPRASAVVYDRKGRRPARSPPAISPGTRSSPGRGWPTRTGFSPAWPPIAAARRWSSSPPPSGTAAWSASTSTTASTSGRRKKPRRSCRRSSPASISSSPRNGIPKPSSAIEARTRRSSGGSTRISAVHRGHHAPRGLRRAPRGVEHHGPARGAIRN